MESRLPLALRSACVVAAIAFPVAAQSRASWTPGMAAAPGIAAGVKDALIADVGQGPSLYVTGNVGAASFAVTPGIARWDGREWHALGDGLGPAEGHSLAVFDDGSGPALYVGGRFIQPFSGANGIARWDGELWSPLGNGLPVSSTNLEVRALAVFDDGSGPALYVCGSGTFALPGSFVARWDGASWQVLAQGGNETISSLAVIPHSSGDWLLASGQFGSFPGAHLGVARWTGAGWTPLGASFAGSSPYYSRVRSIDLGAGAVAHFATGGSPFTGSVHRWDGSTWIQVGASFSRQACDVAVHDDGSGPALYASLYANDYGPTAPPALWKLTGAAWVPAPSPDRGVVHSLVSGDVGQGASLFALGSLLHNGHPIGAVRVDSAVCRVLGIEVPTASWIHRFYTWNDGTGPSLFAVGNFRGLPGLQGAALARWQSGTWTLLGGAFAGTGLALAVFDDGSGPALYAGGSFSNVGGQPRRVIRWNGSGWSPVGVLDGTVMSLAVHTVNGVPRLFAAGEFQAANGAYAGGLYTGGVYVGGLAFWDGAQWAPVPGGSATYGGSQLAYMGALSVEDIGQGSELFVGGTFDTIGGIAATNVARWNGTSWSALGGGLPGSISGGGYFGFVRAFTVLHDSTGPQLVAGGSAFVLPGATGPRSVAQWNGATWTALGSLFGEVITLATVDLGNGPRVHAGFEFLVSPPLAPASQIASWDGSQWNALGAGLLGLQTIAPDPLTPHALLVGGSFVTAGDVVSYGIARWADDGLRIGLQQPGGPAAGVFAHASGLVPGRELVQVFSSDTSAPVGSGPFLGLSSSNPAILVAQASVPLGTAPFHVLAASASTSFGPYRLPPMVLDAVAIELAGGSLTGVSQVCRFAIQ